MVRSLLLELQTLHGSHFLQPRQNMWFWRETAWLGTGVFSPIKTLTLDGSFTSSTHNFHLSKMGLNYRSASQDSHKYVHKVLSRRTLGTWDVLHKHELVLPL